MTAPSATYFGGTTNFRHVAGSALLLKGKRAMAHLEIPSDDQVVEALERLNGHATAIELRDTLMADNHSKSRCELAIQRAADRGRIHILRDWTLSLQPELQVA